MGSFESINHLNLCAKVENILHLNKVKNIGRKIAETTYDLAEALTLICMTRIKYGLIK